MAVTDQYIESFVKEVHSSNSARPTNGKILIPLNVPQSFKSVLFELKDRQMCESLPNVLVLQSINVSQLSILRKERNELLEMISRRKDQSFLDMTFPKLIFF